MALSGQPKPSPAAGATWRSPPAALRQARQGLQGARRAKADDPESRIQAIDYVGPQVGKELRTAAS